MRVLIVDDEPLIRTSLGRVLRSRGHDVVDAENGETGLKIWQDEIFDLVILDVLMPGLSGPQVLEKMAKLKKCPVVLISAYTGEMNFETARQMGADHFIAKPFENIFSVVDEIETFLKKT